MINRDWNDYKAFFDNIDGARISFENVCEETLKMKYPEELFETVRTSQGDGGIDIFVGKIGIEPIKVYQCKFFLYEFAKSQKDQIKKSFDTAITSEIYKFHTWVLCIPYDFDIHQLVWWNKWKKEQIEKYNLNENSIQILKGKQLIELIKKHNLYNKYFKIDKSFLPKLTLEEAQLLIDKSSYNIKNIKNHLGELEEKHIERKQTKEIYDWIVNDLPNIKIKNILVVKGDKGVGKSAIMKDLYSLLVEKQINVLGIKTDRAYSDNRVDLEKKIFETKDVTFQEIIDAYRTATSPLVIIFDQIDALSQTLSSKREYLNTYIKLISELTTNSKVRIIITSRIVDLDLDADLVQFKKEQYTQIEIEPFTDNEVKNILTGLSISNYSVKLIKLLQTPLHLDIFCKLPNKNTLNYNTLNTISDLYNELWKEVVIKNNEYKCKELISNVINKMYVEQKITIQNVYVDNYYRELNYLRSNSILSFNEKEISFVHQSFYEYAIAKEFVEDKKSISAIIIENNQSLYIRSIVKLVLDFLKDKNYSSYLIEIKEILKSKNYLFHIKLLTLNSFATAEKVENAEIDIFQNEIVKNEHLFEAFLTSGLNECWFEYIINKNILKSFINERQTILHRIESLISKEKLKLKNEYRYSILFSFLVRFVNTKHNSIIHFFKNIDDFSTKLNLFHHLLLNVENWENNDYIKEFELMFGKLDLTQLVNNYQYFRILGSISKTNFDYSANKIKSILEELLTISTYKFEINHTIEDGIKKLLEVDKQKTFYLLLEFYIKVGNIQEDQKLFVNDNTSLYKALIISGFSIPEDNDNGFRFIENILLEHIVDTHSIELFGFVFSKLKENNCISYLSFLFKLLNKLTNTENLGIELIKIIDHKNGFNSRDNELTFYIREYLKNNFQNFSIEQKNFIASVILNIKVEKEINIYLDKNNVKKYYSKEFERQKYLFLESLPPEFIKDNSIIRIKYLELDRKFKGNNKSEWRTGSIIAGTVKPPLIKNAYDKMNIKEWINSFKRYNCEREDRFRFSEEDFLKGGLFEHSNALKSQVQFNPQMFFELLKILANRDDLNITYFSNCLGGLIDAKFDAIQLYPYYKLYINKNLSESEVLYSTWKASYFIETGVLDIDGFNYLANLALNHSNPHYSENNKSQDLLNESLNRVRSSAIEKIISCNNINNLKDRIIDVVEKCSNDFHPAVLTSILFNSALLISLDKDRSFKLFETLFDKSSNEVIKHSFNSCQYFLYNYHLQMDFVFKRIINNVDLHKNGGFIIVLCWFYNYKGGEKYFNEFISSSNEAKLEALKLAEKFILKTEYRTKSIHIIKMFLNENEKDISSFYSGVILRKFDKLDFNDLWDFNLEYSKSNLLKSDPSYFLKYLKNNASLYPNEVLILIQNMNFKTPPNIQYSGYYDKEPIQILLSIYSELYNRSIKDIRTIKKALKHFDNLLTIPHLRNNANYTLENIT